MDSYSSDDHLSDLEEDSDPLKLSEPSLSSAPYEQGSQAQKTQSQWHILWIAPPSQFIPENATKL